MHYDLHVRLSPRGCALVLVLAIAIPGGLVAVGYAFREPILRKVGQQLVHHDTPEQSDAIVILAGGSLDRVIKAADLYAAGFASEIVMTRDAPSASIAMLRRRGLQVESSTSTRLRFLQALGVPRSAVEVLGQTVASTEQESRELVAWAARRRIRSFILVTSEFHSARARFIVAQAFQGTDVRLLVVPAVTDDFRVDSWWTDRASLRMGVVEWQKAIFYRLRYR